MPAHTTSKSESRSPVASAFPRTHRTESPAKVAALSASSSISGEGSRPTASQSHAAKPHASVQCPFQVQDALAGQTDPEAPHVFEERLGETRPVLGVVARSAAEVDVGFALRRHVSKASARLAPAAHFWATFAPMYRAPDEDPAARLERAREHHAALAKELGDKRQQAQLLAVQIMKAGGALVVIPPLPQTNITVGDASSIPAAALAGITAEVERATLELEQHRSTLDRMITDFKTRLAGGSVTATLGPAPRPVPFVYRLAEWLSLPFILVVLIGGALSVVLGLTVPPLRFVPAVFVVGAIVWSVIATRRRTRLLSQGSLPVSTSMTDKPTFGSYQNQRMTSYAGWDPVATDYTGPRCKTLVRFVASDGSAGELVVTGMRYKGGIILCAPGGGAGKTAAGLDIARFQAPASRRDRPVAAVRRGAAMGGDGDRRPPLDVHPRRGGLRRLRRRRRAAARLAQGRARAQALISRLRYGASCTRPVSNRAGASLRNSRKSLSAAAASECCAPA